MTQASLLIINSGSSSVKFQVFSNSSNLSLLASGTIANLGTTPYFKIFNITKQNPLKNLEPNCTHEQAIRLILDWISNGENNWDISAVAHRVVHGGELFTNSVRITPEIIMQLKELNSLAPLHQPHNLAAIEIINKLYPNLTQVACFDTAFHSHHSPLFTEYALPLHIREQGVRRYGFHGLSFEWITQVLSKEHPNLLKGRVIAAHLGNGASLCAIHNGISVDTTMGLTALDGLPMGTRSGSLDPGAIIYMIRELGLSVNEVELMLYTESGLIGLSGITNNVEELQKSTNEKAQFAIEYFCLKTAQFMGMMAIAIGGVDAIIFTGGIGENSEWVRTKILSRLQCLQPFTSLVIAANEEKIMAMHTVSILKRE